MNERRAAFLNVKAKSFDSLGLPCHSHRWLLFGAPFIGRRTKPVNRFERHPLIIRFSPENRVSAHLAVGNLHLVISIIVRLSRYLRYSIAVRITKTLP
jgi:hypothetical protein